MTEQRKLKARIRDRMASTGEAYMVARRHVLDAAPSAEWLLRGGIHPETATLAGVLANRGVTDPSTGEPISESLILGIGGGLGAGYILWEFDRRDQPSSRIVTTGFRNRWQYPDRWIRAACERLGIAVEVHETGGAGKAATQLDDALKNGLPSICWISAADVGYWHLPASESGWWGYPITVYGREGDRFFVDDRNTAPLTIDADTLAAARGRIPSYKNRLVVPDAAATEVDGDRLVAAIDAGIAEQIEHLSATSESFSLPAFGKWARMLTATKGAKAWSTVFADGHGVFAALASSHQAVSPVGVLGGNLRALYADFLTDAARLLDRPDLIDAAEAYRAAADAWAAFAQACLPPEVPAVAAAISAAADRRAAVARGDAGSADAAAAAERFQGLGADHERLVTDDATFAAITGRMAEALQAAHTAEVAALGTLRAVRRSTT